VILATFGDAIRVPGSRKSLLQAKRTAPMCASSIRRSTL
jgi:hydrogenase maturation factor